jgi:2-C-methyl-D-erythritol 4-phosphate cytidylyltransferase
LIIKAYADLPADFAATDDAEVVERTGHGVAIVETDRRNIKITLPGDMALALALSKDMARKPKGRGLGAFEEAQW